MVPLPNYGHRCISVPLSTSTWKLWLRYAHQSIPGRCYFIYLTKFIFSVNFILQLIQFKLNIYIHFTDFKVNTLNKIVIQSLYTD